MEKPKKKLILIDGNSLLHRAFHALPPLTTASGQEVGAVFGFTSMLLKVFADLKPEYVAVAWDTPKPTFRHVEYVDYKAHRPELDKDLEKQIEQVKEVVEVFNLPQYEVEGYEADDVIGTLAEQAKEEKIRREEKIETVIVTGDLDALQLVDKDTKVYTSRRGFTDTMTYDHDAVLERFGVEPVQLVDYKALCGDPSDNIPGVKGIGKKTTTELLSQYQNISEIYKHLKNLSDKISGKLADQQEQALLSRNLAEIRRDVPIELNLDQCRLKDYDQEEVFRLFQKLEFRSMINKLPESGSETQEVLFGETSKGKASLDVLPSKGKEYSFVDSEDSFKHMEEELVKISELTVDVETTSINPWEAELVGVALTTQPGRALYVPWKFNVQSSKFKVIEKLKEILENKQIAKIGHNLKYDALVLSRHGIDVSPFAFDTMLAAYLLQAGQGRLNLKDLAFSQLGMVIPRIEELLGTGKNKKTMDKIDIERVTQYACSDVDATLRLKRKLEASLTKDYNLEKLFDRLEMPLLPVLLDMEKHGVLVDRQLLAKLSKDLQKKIEKTELVIYQNVGHEFNLNSPKQLEEVLFDELHLPMIKRTKTQRSTDESVLRKLRGSHPIIEPLLEYREIFKLKSTYLDPLPNLLDSKGRVHTIFNQARTATGRLSSENPNLQNIPKQDECNLRCLFIAPTDFKLLVADYSQIELRIIAHFSQDEALINSFENDQDIHSATAARIFDCFINEVTPEQRGIAKTLNFAVMYGMSPHGLSDLLQIEHLKAAQYIDEYFANYPQVKSWIEDLVRQAHEEGFVESLWGRRRVIPDLASENTLRRAAAERIAINMRVQSTAVDMIKKAMVDVYSYLTDLRAKLILQVHDELVFEVPQEKVDETAEVVRKKMESAMELRVPVKVDLAVGDNWGELEKLKTQNSKGETTT